VDTLYVYACQMKNCYQNLLGHPLLCRPTTFLQLNYVKNEIVIYIRRNAKVSNAFEKKKKITLTEPVVSMQRRSCLLLRSQASSERGLVPSLAKRCLRTFFDAQSASRRECVCKRVYISGDGV
jgi:hypothetical protein